MPCGGIANGGVMMTPHFYKSSKGDEKDWGEGERAISEDAASQVTSCIQTVVSEGTGVGGAVDGYDVAGKTGTAERADENGGYLKENYMSSFIPLRRHNRPRCCAISHSMERRAARMPLRCHSSPLWPTRSTCWVSAHEVGGYNLEAWSAV